MFEHSSGAHISKGRGFGERLEGGIYEVRLHSSLASSCQMANSMLANQYLTGGF